jgi:hypothetical protein
MKHLTFTVTDIQRLNSIKTLLYNKQSLTTVEQEYLLDFLIQVPTPNTDLLKDIALDEPIEVRVWDVIKIDEVLKKWRMLLMTLPGFDFAPFVEIIDQTSAPRLFHKNIILSGWFSPTLAHNEFEGSEPFEIHLKDNGTASFWFPTFEDAEQYPELYNFKGSWKEAYLLLIETMKKGWPMEEFPKELLPLLKK